MTTTKPMTRRPETLDELRVMPEPFFQGSKLAMTIGDIMGGRSGGRERKLAPGQRRLGGWILPDFQRPSVWTREQEISLIESIWLELPIGAFVWNSLWGRYGHPCDGWLLDGQQRLTAMLAYTADEFPVFGYRFSEISAPDRRRWDFGMPIACIETQIPDPELCRQVYERLAYGGTPHSRGA